MNKFWIAMLGVVLATSVMAEDVPKPAEAAALSQIAGNGNNSLNSDGTLRLLTSGGPGVYNFYKYDKSEIQAKYLDQVFKKQDMDYKYFLETVNAIEKGFTDLLKDTVYEKNNGLKSISDRTVFAKQTEFIAATDFLEAINRFNLAQTSLQARIETLTAIADGLVPSAELIEAKDSGLKTLPNYGKQNFEPIKKFYAERLALVEKFVSDLPHNIELPGEIPFFIKAKSGKGLVLEADDAFVRLTPDKVKELRKKLLLLRTWDEEAEDALADYTRFLMDRIFAFNKTYGSGEKYRYLGPVEQQKRDEEVKAILGNFWSRSYLRAVYGMPLCVIGVSYNKDWFSLDVFRFSTRALLNLHEHPECDANSMVQLDQNYRNLLRRADNRAEKLMDGNLSFIGSVENLLTFLGGNRNEAVAATTMLRLLAADLYEERLLLETGSVAQMADRYRQRYYSTPEDEAFFRKLQLAYDSDMTPETIREIYTDANRPEMIEKILGTEKDAAFQTTAGLGTGENLRTKFAGVVIHMETKVDELKQAEIIESQIANALNPNNKFRAAVQSRKKNL